MLHAVILAAGSQQRWVESGGKGRKQFIVIDGERLIDRAYRLACEYAYEVFTVVQHPEDPAWKGLNPVKAAHEPWMGEMGKFLDHRPYWPERGEVVVLNGDTYYSEATVKTIFTHKPDQPTIYGRATAGRSESFGIRFRVPEDVEEVERIARAVAKAGLNKRGGPWRWFWYRHTGETRYGKQERRRLTELATRKNGWIECGHDETDDFDYAGNLQAWQERNPRRRVG